MYAHDNFLNIVELWYQDIFSPRISKEKILAKNANEGIDKSTLLHAWVGKPWHVLCLYYKCIWVLYIYGV